MGYHLSQRQVEFSLKKEDYARALEAVKATAFDKSKMAGAVVQGGQVVARYFGFTDMRYVNFTTLPTALECWRWQVKENDDGICGLTFIGEKYTGDMRVVFEALAPFVADGSYIVMQGEDGLYVRWSFDKGNVKEEWLQVNWSGK